MFSSLSLYLIFEDQYGNDDAEDNFEVSGNIVRQRRAIINHQEGCNIYSWEGIIKETIVLIRNK